LREGTDLPAFAAFPCWTAPRELEARGMVIGMRRDAEGGWMACRIEGVECEGEMIGFQGQTGRGDGWLAAGGLLPPGAVSARVLGAGDTWQPATCVAGAWVAYVRTDRRRFGAPPVRFLDADGALVAAPWPPGQWKLRPVPDYDECPVCGSRSWQAGALLTDSAGERYACSACGYSDGGLVCTIRVDRAATPRV
jgi:hypothetical protein